MSVKLDNIEALSTNILDSKNEELQLVEDEEEDISFTYRWPPLVCCFGAAQHLFIPSGRPANRLIDHEIHDSKKDMFWSPTKFIRAPGGPSSSVAVALAKIGGRVEFMGKLGDDEYGQTMLYYLNESKVQTRSVKLDSSKPTAVSHMKIAKRGRLRVSCVEPCAEDSFLSSDINVDVLKEVNPTLSKMHCFYVDGIYSCCCYFLPLRYVTSNQIMLEDFLIKLLLLAAAMLLVILN